MSMTLLVFWRRFREDIWKFIKTKKNDKRTDRKSATDNASSRFGCINEEWWARKNGFEDGAEWRINSVWHDAIEVPEANKRVLVCFENVIGEYVYYRIRAFNPNVLKNWNMGNCVLGKVLRWCHLDDLLPERKEETE